MERRKFLKGVLPAGFMVPSLVSGLGFRAYESGHQFINNMLLPAGDNDRVLVIVQLNGGNDGLNTVIPLEYFSSYVNARKNIFIKESSVLRLDGQERVGLHPAMTGMQELFNQGKLQIIQSVGYPQPNFSHFRATDIWMSGSDSTQILNTGWLGRYLDEAFPGFPEQYPNNNMPDPLAIQIGSVTSFAIQGPSQPMGLSIANPSSFYKFINNTEDPAPNSNAGKELTYVRQLTRQTQKYGDVIKNANAKVTVQSNYPTANSLADQLKIVARLIKGGLKTKIYLVNYGGFDTHANQVVTGNNETGTHATLLRNVSNAIKAFQDDLKFLNIEDRVMGMTFSEFGRRILSNGSSGTDHGAAAPLFVFGKHVQSRVTGATPVIPNNTRVGDNLPYQYDFRSVYASLLANWLCVDTTLLNRVMLKDFQQLPLVNPAVCSPTVPGTGLTEGLMEVKVYPNPFQSYCKISFKTNGGHTLVQLMDGAGRMVKTLFEKDANSGIYHIEFNGQHLPEGIYYIRVQNLALQNVKSVLKVR